MRFSQWVPPGAWMFWWTGQCCSAEGSIQSSHSLLSHLHHWGSGLPTPFWKLCSCPLHWHQWGQNTLLFWQKDWKRRWKCFPVGAKNSKSHFTLGYPLPWILRSMFCSILWHFQYWEYCLICSQRLVYFHPWIFQGSGSERGISLPLDREPAGCYQSPQLFN